MTTTPETRTPTAEQIARKALVKTQREGLPRPRQAAQVIADIRAAGLLGGDPTEEQIERAARALFEDPNVTAEYTWAEMVTEDPSRADIWREDARRVLAAAGAAPQEPSETLDDHDFLPVAGHPDDDECTHRADGTDLTYCGEPRRAHEAPISRESVQECTCPSGDGSLRWPCPSHPPAPSSDREKLIAEARAAWDAAGRIPQGTMVHETQWKPFADLHNVTERLIDALAFPPAPSSDREGVITDAYNVVTGDGGIATPEETLDALNRLWDAAALAAPPTVDEEKLAEVVSDQLLQDWGIQSWRAARVIGMSNRIARAVIEWWGKQR